MTPDETVRLERAKDLVKRLGRASAESLALMRELNAIAGDARELGLSAAEAAIIETANAAEGLTVKAEAARERAAGIVSFAQRIADRVDTADAARGAQPHG